MGKKKQPDQCHFNPCTSPVYARFESAYYCLVHYYSASHGRPLVPLRRVKSAEPVSGRLIEFPVPAAPNAGTASEVTPELTPTATGPEQPRVTGEGRPGPRAGMSPAPPAEPVMFVRPHREKRRGATMSSRGELVGQFNTRMPLKVRDDLEAAARAANMSITRFIVEVLRAARITDFEWSK